MYAFEELSKYVNDYEPEQTNIKKPKKLLTAEEKFDGTSTAREYSLTSKVIDQVVILHLKKRLRHPLERCGEVGADGFDVMLSEVQP